MMTIERYMDLPENIYGAFDEMTDKAYELFVKNKYDVSFNMYQECFDMIPEPKKDYGESSNVIQSNQ